MTSYSPTVGAAIVRAASRFVGLTEVRSNAVWDKLDTPAHDVLADEFKAELLRVGWQTGWPYCAAFCEVAWKLGYQGRPELANVRAMLTPSCLSSWKNAVNAGWNSQEPRLGSIGIMRKGATDLGHAFIVRGMIDRETIATIEANTSPMPGSLNADREGDGVYCKTRSLTFKPTTGLHLIGFITPLIDS